MDQKHHAMVSAYWTSPAVIAQTNFQFKSLCDFTFNTAVGCSHGCSFCYVPSVSANKQGPLLAQFGVEDPDAQWGRYVLPRHWDENAFLASLGRAEKMPADKLKPEGHRAVMFCSTTDPYQVIRNPDPKLAKQYNEHHQEIVRRALILIRELSTLNVRILTRSPLAKRDFDLFRTFGNRLVFGMSIPTLNSKLARAFEPHAPDVKKRLETLQAAKKLGLHVYAALAPTYPDCGEDDLRATLQAFKEIDPITIYHEPINVRAENVERIRSHAKKEGIILDLTPFASPPAWREYASGQLHLVERLSETLGLRERLHLWPDKDIIQASRLRTLEDPSAEVAWVTKCWRRISEWPE